MEELPGIRHYKAVAARSCGIYITVIAAGYFSRELSLPYYRKLTQALISYKISMHKR